MSEGKTTHEATLSTEDEIRRIRHELDVMPLPAGGQIDPEEALRWLQEDFGPYMTIVTLAPTGTEDKAKRDALSFLAADVRTMVEVSTRAIATQEPQPLYQRDDAETTCFLARVVTTRESMDHSTGPFEWAYDQLADELARRAIEPFEADLKRWAAEWKPRKPPLSSLSPEEQALHGCE